MIKRRKTSTTQAKHDENRAQSVSSSSDTGYLNSDSGSNSGSESDNEDHLLKKRVVYVSKEPTPQVRRELEKIYRLVVEPTSKPATSVDGATPILKQAGNPSYSQTGYPYPPLSPSGDARYRPWTPSTSQPSVPDMPPSTQPAAEAVATSTPRRAAARLLAPLRPKPRLPDYASSARFSKPHPLTSVTNAEGPVQDGFDRFVISSVSLYLSPGHVRNS